MRMHRLLLLPALALAACGEAPPPPSLDTPNPPLARPAPPPPAPLEIDGCALISEYDVVRAIGPLEGDPARGDNSCVYVGKSHQAVVVSAVPVADYDALLTKAKRSGHWEPIDGSDAVLTQMGIFVPRPDRAYFVVVNAYGSEKVERALLPNLRR